MKKTLFVAPPSFFLFFLIFIVSCSKKNVEVLPDPTVTNTLIYTANHTGDIFAVNAQTGRQEWVYKTRTTIYSSPIVSNKILYIGNNAGKFFAIDAESGLEKWVVSLGNGWIVSSPVVDNNVVFVGTSSGYSYALNALTGQTIWRFATNIIYSSPAVSNGIVYFASLDKNLYAIDAKTGALQWKRTDGYQNASPVVRNGILFIRSQTALDAIDAKSGNLKWSSPCQSFSDDGTAVVSDNSVYFIGNSTLYSVNLQTGALIWKVKFSDSVYPTLISDENGLYVQGNIFVASYGNSSSEQVWASKLYAIDSQNGVQKWGFNPVQDYYGKSWAVLPGPTAANGEIYMTSQDGFLYCIDPLTGKQKWEFDTGNYIWGSPCVLSSDSVAHRGLGGIQ